MKNKFKKKKMKNIFSNMETTDETQNLEEKMKNGRHDQSRP